MTLILPVPTGGSPQELQQWAAEMTRILQQETAQGDTLPIEDDQGRIIVSGSGHTVYRSDGTKAIVEDVVQIDTGDLVDAAITTVKLANSAVDTDKLNSLAVTAAKLADSSVESAKIANAAVGTAAIANLAVGTAQIADAAVLRAKIGDAEIVQAKIADLAVNDAKIADLAVGKLTAGTIGVANVFLGSSQFHLDGANTLLKIDDTQSTPQRRINLGKLGGNDTDYGIEILDSSGNTVLSASGLGTDVVDTGQIVNAAITNAKIANLAVDTAQIASAAITNAKIGSAAVDTAEIANAAITNAKIANLAVDTAQIASAAITNAKIANLAVDSAQITDLAVQNAKIDNLSVSTGKVQDGAISDRNVSTSSGGEQLGASFSLIVGANVSGDGTVYAIGTLHVRNSQGSDGEVSVRVDIEGDTFTANEVVPANGDAVVTIGHAAPNSGSTTNVDFDASEVSGGLIVEGATLYSQVLKR